MQENMQTRLKLLNPSSCFGSNADCTFLKARCRPGEFVKVTANSDVCIVIDVIAKLVVFMNLVQPRTTDDTVLVNEEARNKRAKLQLRLKKNTKNP